MRYKLTYLVLFILIVFMSHQHFSNYKRNNLHTDSNLEIIDSSEFNPNFDGFFISVNETSSNECSRFDYYQGSIKTATFTTTKVEFCNLTDKIGYNNITFEFLNKNVKSKPIALNVTPTLFHFFFAEDINTARINIKTYSSIIYRNIWSNIDLVYYGTNQGIKYKFIIHNEAELLDINLKVSVNDIEQNQILNDLMKNVIGLETRFRISDSSIFEDFFVYIELLKNNIIQFNTNIINLNEYTIDSFVFSTYINSNCDDRINSIVTDEKGYIYIGGYTNGLDFPTNNSFDDTYNGNDDIFIMKFSPDGSSLIYSTFLGSSYSEGIFDLTIDKFDNLIGTGYITGNGLPTTAVCYDPSYNGDYDGFVFKLNASCSGLDYCSYFGTDEYDVGKSVSVSSKGFIYVLGITKSTNLPVTMNSFDVSYNGGFDTFLIKINPNNTIIDYCTYIGGSLNESGTLDMNINENGILYCCGGTESTDFPTLTNSFDSTFNGGKTDGYFFLFNTTNDELYYSSFFGGSNDDVSQGINFDYNGNIYLAGYTYSSDLPITQESYDTTYNLNKDIFITKFTQNGSNLYWSTYLGGTNIDDSFGMAIDDQNNVHLTGMTSSHNFPINSSIFSENYMGENDAFLTILSSNGSQILCSTYIGCSSVDSGTSIAIDSNGYTIVGGITQSSDLYTSTNAFEKNYQTGGLFGWDSFLMKFKAISTLIELKDLLNNSDVIEGTRINLNVTYVDTVLYNWDNGLNQTLNFPYQTLIPESPGKHILSVYANDTSNNWISTKYVFYVNPDIDQDGLTNLQEVFYGTDPWNNDTDFDGLTDGDEIIKYNTNPLSIDTDGDGFSDYIEISNGYDPNNPEDHPPLTPFPTTVIVAPTFGLGYKITLIIILISLVSIIVLLIFYIFRKKKIKDLI